MRKKVSSKKYAQNIEQECVRRKGLRKKVSAKRYAQKGKFTKVCAKG